MRFPRTIRFDVSDEQVFERAAEPDEWAVSGAFAFADADPDSLSGKRRQAFRSGLLGTRSFGWSTFAVVAEIGTDELEGVVAALARHFIEHYSAPSLEAARVAARAETEFAADLCDHKVNTLIAVEREFGPKGIVERFRTIEPAAGGAHARIWTIVDDEETGQTGSDPSSPGSDIFSAGRRQ
jgi:hypothetical protein